MANILLVDDDVLIARIFSRYLSNSGHKIETSFDGREALDKLVQTNFDLVLTDNSMPRLSGTRLIGITKGLPENRRGDYVDIYFQEDLERYQSFLDCYSKVPFVLLSMDTEMEELAKKVEAAEFICKKQIQSRANLLEIVGRYV